MKTDIAGALTSTQAAVQRSSHAEESLKTRVLINHRRNVFGM